MARRRLSALLGVDLAADVLAFDDTRALVGIVGDGAAIRVVFGA